MFSLPEMAIDLWNDVDECVFIRNCRWKVLKIENVEHHLNDIGSICDGGRII